MAILDRFNGRDNLEKIYISLKVFITYIKEIGQPYLRRVQRFLALPYCFFFLTDYKNIDRKNVLIALDFLYIFFVLRSFPDNYYPCRLWEKPRKDWAYYYGSNYNPFQRQALRKSVQPKKYEILFEDKWVCSDLCKAHNIPIPASVGTIRKGQNFYNSLTSLARQFPNVNRFIVKPVDGKGGHAISIFERSGSELYQLKDGSLTPSQKDQNAPVSHIVQEYVTQHRWLNEYSQSVNTIRIVTIQRPDCSIHIIGSYIRFGIGTSLIDNLSQGGIAVKIDVETGELGSYALDRFGAKYYNHPTSKKEFIGFKIPNWERVCSLASEVQTKLCYQTLLGMDIAVTEKGATLIEVNSIYDNIDLEQVCGPVLANPKTLEIYRQHNLLINKQQKSLI